MKILLIVVMLAGCCNRLTRVEVESLCEGHGGVHTIHLTWKKPIHCTDGTKFTANDLRYKFKTK